MGVKIALAAWSRAVTKMTKVFPRLTEPVTSAVSPTLRKVGRQPDEHYLKVN